MKKDVEKAIEILKRCGIVIFPTDTVFGIGCRIDDEMAVEKLFKIKRKPEERVAPVLIDSIKMAQKYLEPIPKDVVKKLIKPYWPGGLTIVLRCIPDKVPVRLQGRSKTLGIRMPNYGSLLKIIEGVGAPIVGSSANSFGDEAPDKFSKINKKLISRVDFVLTGKCTKKVPSTVVDCTKKPWRILREGAVKLDL